MNDVGWNFPPTGGGSEDGLNNPGIAHFEGDRLDHLAREILQNSLDALVNKGEPVVVTFESKKFSSNEIPGIDELIDHLDKCIEKCESQKPVVPTEKWKRAKSILMEDQVDFLKIYDSNTTGLIDTNWNALVKGSGISVKSHDTAGGSFGIGKNAVFAVSSARTVYYWTAYKVDSTDSFVEKFQGKSVLMSHPIDGIERQGTGFYGDRENCRELDSQNTLDKFRNLRNREPIQSTAISIAGFQAEDGWQNKIASHVIKNFFCAIERGSLKVVLEPDESMSESDLIEINSESLDQWIEKLENECEEEMKDTRLYLNLIRNPSSAIDHVDDDLGLCRIWVETGEKYPRRVALIRSMGMLITTDQNNTRVRGVQDFVALCIFEDTEGNRILRQMENPQHNQFSSDFLSEDERSKGREILTRITEWIKSQIRDCAGRQAEGTSDQLTELSRYLPLDLSDGALDIPDREDMQGEPAFGRYGEITSKPVTVNTYPTLTIETDEGGDSDDNDDEFPEGESTNGGNSNGRPKTPGNGENTVWKRMDIADVRVLPQFGRAGVYTVSFLPKESGTVHLRFEVAGDHSSEPLTKILEVCVSDDGKLNCSPLSEYRVTKNERFAIQIFDSTKIENTAWTVLAGRVKKQ